MQDPLEAIWSFHHRGAFYGFALRSPAFGPPLERELMTPAGFLLHNAQVLKTVSGWQERPSDAIEQDPRYIAYKCGWDRLIIPHLPVWRDTVEKWIAEDLRRRRYILGFKELDPIIDPSSVEGDELLLEFDTDDLPMDDEDGEVN